MTEREFKARTKRFAVRVIRMVESFPKNRVGDVLGRQVLRLGTSVGANYRAACRAKSAKDLVAKLAIVEEEAEETQYWIELAVEAGIVEETKVADLLEEAGELLAMTVASMKTLRPRAIQNPKSKI